MKRHLYPLAKLGAILSAVILSGCGGDGSSTTNAASAGTPPAATNMQSTIVASTAAGSTSNSANSSSASSLAPATPAASAAPIAIASVGSVAAVPQIRDAVRKTETVLEASTVVHVVLALNLNDAAGLSTYVSQMQTPGSASFKKTLTPAQIATRFGPTQAKVNAVVAYLQGQGFSNVKVAPNNLLIEADAPSTTVASSFKTTLAKYTLEDGSVAHANTTAATLPSNLAGIVHSVLGLDTVSRAHTYSVQAKAITSASTNAAALTGHIPTTFPAIYNVGNTPTASTTVVGIIAEGNLTQALADLQTFESQQKLPAVPTSVTYAGAEGSDTTGTNEWDIDSQDIVGMSGGVKQINFYVAPSMAWSDLALAMNAAVTANAAKVINMSIGGCEANAPITTIDPILQTAVAQGQTFVVATGDSGSVAYGCSTTSVEYPASSAYALAVGGTSLSTNGSAYASETAWTDSGGGISTIAALPTWQSSVPALSGKTKRGTPDIAFDADPNSGALVIVNGATAQWGGTSLAAPLFTATWARMLSSCSPSGFVPPILYSLESGHPNIFQDITSGSNGAYSAGAGWDFVTGWGTPNISNMWAAVCTPPTPKPTINLTISPNPMVAGQPYTEFFGATNATSLTFTCTSTGTGWTATNASAPINTSYTGTASAAWVGYPTNCVWTAVGPGGTTTYTNTYTTVSPPPKPTINLTISPNPMVAGQPYTEFFGATNATSLTFTCTSTGTGWTATNASAPINGTYTGTASAAWVGYPTNCVWTAVGPGGTTTYTNTYTTVNPPPKPTINLTISPNPMVAGQPYTEYFGATNATSLTFTCTSSGTGWTATNASAPINTSYTGTASAAWVGYPTNCVWTAVGPGGTTTYTNTYTTVN
jgi:subtilase family serine protease